MEETYISNQTSDFDLPSKGLVYSGVDVNKIGIRTFKGKDEKLLASLNSDNFEKRVLAILNSVIKGIEAPKLTVGDRLYILIWEGINSYSKDYVVEDTTCLNCFEKIDVSVDLSKLEVINLPADYKEPYPINLSTGEVANLRLFRVEDEIKIADYEKSTSQSSWLYRFAHSIVSDKNIWDVVNWLEGLPSKDIATIRAFQNKFYHGPKLETSYVCPKCGGTGIMPVPFRLKMFFPYGDALDRFAGNGV